MAEIEEKQELKGNIQVRGTIVGTSISEKGDKGEKGESFKYEDFTPEQLEKLKGKNGLDGKDGSNGATFIPNVDKEGNLSWSNDKNLPNPELVNIKGKQGERGESFKYEDFTPEQLEKLKGENGADGKDGAKGENGATFIPNVDEEGNLTWTNDKNLPNPEKINLKTGVNSINGLQGDIVETRYNTTLMENLISTELEIPANYKVGTNCLQVYFEGDLLEKDIHYEEVGDPDSISNKIKIDWLTKWKEETGEDELIFSFIIQRNL